MPVRGSVDKVTSNFHRAFPLARGGTCSIHQLLQEHRAGTFPTFPLWGRHPLPLQHSAILAFQSSFGIAGTKHSLSTADKSYTGGVRDKDEVQLLNPTISRCGDQAAHLSHGRSVVKNEVHSPSKI